MTTPSPPIPPPSSLSSFRKLRLLLQNRSRQSAQNIDTFILRIQKLFSTPIGTETTLATIEYSLTLLHAYLNHRLKAQLGPLAQTIQPVETLIATVSIPPECAALARHTDAIKKLVSLISDYRIFIRLWGLLELYKWARATWSEPPPNATLKTITWAQVLVNVTFQFLENGAYLAQHGVLNGGGWSGEEGEKRQMKWWLWSARFWAAHVALDVIRLGYLMYSERKLVEDEKSSKTEVVEEWWRDAVCNVAYAPMTVHWSLEEGLLNEAWVGALGATAGLAGLRLLWKSTAG